MHCNGTGTYQVYIAKTNRIVLTRDVKWGDFKPKQLKDDMDLFSPG